MGRKRRGGTPLEKAAAGLHPAYVIGGPSGPGGGGGAGAHELDWGPGPATECCSPWWEDLTKYGGVRYPPQANSTPMRRCRSGQKRCGKTYPFYYVGESCSCADCREGLRLQQQGEFARWDASGLPGSYRVLSLATRYVIAAPI